MIKQLNQRGAVSFISVVLFATVVTIVVAAYASSALSQQRDSVRYDHSTRAYYAAETGVQDAIRAIRAADPGDVNSLANQPKGDCTPLVQPDAEDANDSFRDQLNLGYTCQLIDPEPNTIPVKLNPAENTLMRLNVESPEAGDYQLVIRWSKATLDENDEHLPRPANREFLPENSWQSANYHAAVRASVIHFPLNANPVSPLQNVFFLNPTPQGAGTGTATITRPDDAQTVHNQEGFVQAASCVPSSEAEGYACQQAITLGGYNFTQDAVYLRLSALYGSTDVEVALVKNDGTPASLKNTVAEIDVTGRSADVYRRIKQSVSLRNGITIDTLPEAAVIAGDGICKLYRIGNQPGQFVDDGCEY